MSGPKGDALTEGAIQALRERREAVVHEHMESENLHDFEVTLGTFEHPRYEIVATGEVHDGREEVAEYFRSSRAAFPDQRNENAVFHYADASASTSTRRPSPSSFSVAAEKWPSRWLAIPD